MVDKTDHHHAVQNRDPEQSDKSDSGGFSLFILLTVISVWAWMLKDKTPTGKISTSANALRKAFSRHLKYIAESSL
jgi:heme/copper-type cytochrome/quinol oxidase subunit 4